MCTATTAVLICPTCLQEAPNRDLVSLREVAERLDQSLQSVRIRAWRESLWGMPVVRVPAGGSVRRYVRRSDLDALIASR